MRRALYFLIVLAMLLAGCVDPGGDGSTDTYSVRKTAVYGEQQWHAQETATAP
jgi:hypothetical protein